MYGDLDQDQGKYEDPGNHDHELKLANNILMLFTQIKFAMIEINFH